MDYKINTFRAAGLQAKWGKVNNRPAIFARNSNSTPFYLVNKSMWKLMKENGIIKGFEQATALADIFSVEA